MSHCGRRKGEFQAHASDCAGVEDTPLQHPAKRDCTMTRSHLSRHSSIVGAGAAICGKTHAAHLRHNVASSFLRFPHRFQPQAERAMASAKHASRCLDTNGTQLKCASGETPKVFRVS